MKTAIQNAVISSMIILVWCFAIAATGYGIVGSEARANPLKCNVKKPLLCRKAIIEILRKAGLNQYFIEDGDIMLTIDESSAQYAAIKDTKIGIFVHEYNGVTVKSRELTIEDVVGFESAAAATKGHHPRYGLNVLTTLATTGSFSQPLPQMVTVKLPGQTQETPIKVKVTTFAGTPNERTFEFVLRKDDQSLAISGMQALGLLDKNLNLMVSKLDASNTYTLSASALAKLANVPVDSLTGGANSNMQYSFSVATADDLKRDSLDITRTPAGTAQLILKKPTPPTQDALPSASVKLATSQGISPGQQGLLDASNLLGTFTGRNVDAKTKVQQYDNIKKILAQNTGLGSISDQDKTRITQQINAAQKIINLLGGVSSYATLTTKVANGDLVPKSQRDLLRIAGRSETMLAAALRDAVLGAGAGDRIFRENDRLGQTVAAVKSANKRRQQDYQKALAAYKKFEAQQANIAQQLSGASGGGIKFYAIDGSASYANANEFLKAHGQVDATTGQVKSFNDLTKATPNPNHGGSLGYQHFGGSPEFLTSRGNPTPKPYWVHEYVCQDATCSSYTAVNEATSQSSDQGRLFRLDNYSGSRRAQLESLIMDGNLDGADPSGRAIHHFGDRLFIFEPLRKDPATTWQPALLHSFNQAATGSGAKFNLPPDLSGFSVGYQVCGPGGCVGTDSKTGNFAMGVVTQLGVIAEKGGLLNSLQGLGAVSANGQIKGIGKDKDGKIVVFTQSPGSSDLVKFTFSRATASQIQAAGLKPVSKPIPLVATGAKPTIYTLTVGDQKGGIAATILPGIVTEDNMKNLISAGIITQQNGQYVIKGTQNKDGTVSTKATIGGSQYSFTFHPGISAPNGNSGIPTAVTQALNRKQVTRFFNQNSAQAAAVASLNPLGQNNNPPGMNPGSSLRTTPGSTTQAGQQSAIQAQQHVAHVHAQRLKAINGASAQTGTNPGSSLGTTSASAAQVKSTSAPASSMMPSLPSVAKKTSLVTMPKPRTTVTFGHKIAPPNIHVDAQNVNQYFVTPSAGNQFELNEAPKFVDSNNKQWLCAVSGLGHRIAVNSQGKKTVHGHAETLSFIDPAVRDIPGASLNVSSNCLISINHD